MVQSESSSRFRSEFSYHQSRVLHPTLIGALDLVQARLLIHMLDLMLRRDQSQDQVRVQDMGQAKVEDKVPVRGLPKVWDIGAVQVEEVGQEMFLDMVKDSDMGQATTKVETINKEIIIFMF